MILAIAGGARMGAFQLHESLLDLITRRMRGICKTLKELTCTAIKQ
ncbi:protease FtsH-inhibitory lysogeny factor CIII [Cronobacter sakazakii]